MSFRRAVLGGVVAAVPMLALLAVAVPSANARPAWPADASVTEAAAHDGESDAPRDAARDARRRDAAPIAPILPDPVPLESAKQWIVELRFSRGDVFLVAVQKVELEAPRTTPRVIGRFALELYEGATLLERVRFDFPGLLDGDFVDAGHRDPPRIDRRLSSKIGVMLPRSERGTRLELWDRATDRRFPLPWPLAETPR